MYKRPWYTRPDEPIRSDTAFAADAGILIGTLIILVVLVLLLAPFLRLLIGG